MSRSTPAVRTLHRAVAIYGGVAGLAKASGVSVAQLYVHPATDIYIRALDLVAGGGYTGPKETR
jgi:hypothetical protein